VPRKATVRLLPTAEQDFSQIVLFVAEDNRRAATRLLNKIETKLVQLEKFPALGGIPSDPDLAAVGYRFLVVGNYLIFYTLEPGAVIIHRILHGARDYRQLLL
jgi:plasmid stabilization system protein ParE